MKMNLKGFLIFFSVLLMSFFQGCVKEKLPYAGDSEDNLIRFYVNTKSVAGLSNGVNVSNLRIIVVKDKDVVYNKTTKNGGLIDMSGNPGEGLFNLTLRPDVYTIYVIGNETNAMATTLNNVADKEAIDDLRVVPTSPDIVFSDSNIPLIESKQFILKSGTGGSSGIVVVDGVESPQLAIGLKRAYAKVELNVRKYTQDGADILIKSVELGHIPMYSYVYPKVYSKTNTFQSFTLNIDGVNDVHLADDVTQEQFNMVSDSQLASAGYNSVPVKNNIFPEYLPSEKNVSSEAAYLNIYATYDGKDVVYRFNLRNSLSIEDYTISRNIVYKVWLTITKIGVINGFKLYVQVKDWDEEIIDVDNRAPYLNVSDIFVNNSDAQNTARVYFWTNQPIEKQSIEIKCYKQNGASKEELNLADTFTGLTGADISNFHTFAVGTTPSDMNYNGYIDFVLTDAAKADGTYYVTLNTAGLKREITINYKF